MTKTNSTPDLKKIQKALPSEILWLASTRDEDVPDSALVMDPKQPQLPQSHGKTGGHLTAQLLEALRHQRIVKSDPLTWASWCTRIQQGLQQHSDYHDSLPQLSSSRYHNVHKEPAEWIPINNNTKGTKRAVLIGVQYTALTCTTQNGTTGVHSAPLTACHANLRAVQDYLISVAGFSKSNITLLIDEPGHEYFPKRHNVLASIRRLASQSRAGDVAYVHFIGHGGLVSSPKGPDKFEPCLLPSDFDTKGTISSTDWMATLLQNMPAQTRVRVCMDVVHGGSIVRLPYVYQPDSGKSDMIYDPAFDVVAILGLALVGAVIAAENGDVTGEETVEEGCMEGCDCCCDGLLEDGCTLL